MELVNRFKKLSNHIEDLQDDLDKKEKEIDKTNIMIDNLVSARWILTELQKKRQERFKAKIDSLVSMAIKSVYDRPFGFELVFEEKRNKTEARPLIYEIVDGEKEYYDDPENELGGGIVDICAFALRCVLWTMEKPRSRNVFVFDEPGKNLGSLITLFGQMLRETSHALKIQMIVITHDEQLIEIADRVYRISHDGRESHIELIKENKKIPLVVPDKFQSQRRKRQ